MESEMKCVPSQSKLEWTCQICNTQGAPFVLNGCGHSVCFSCSKKVEGKCPFCRIPFKDVKPNYALAECTNMSFDHSAIPKQPTDLAADVLELYHFAVSKREQLINFVTMRLLEILRSAISTNPMCSGIVISFDWTDYKNLSEIQQLCQPSQINAQQVYQMLQQIEQKLNYSTASNKKKGVIITKISKQNGDIFDIGFLLTC